MTKRRKLERKWRSNKSEYNRKRYLYQFYTVNNLVCQMKMTFYSTLMQNRFNQAGFLKPTTNYFYMMMQAVDNELFSIFRYISNISFLAKAIEEAVEFKPESHCKKSCVNIHNI